MGSLELNKAFAAVLTAGIAFMVAGLVGSALVKPERLEHSAIKIEGAENPTAGNAAPQEPSIPPIGPLLAKANAQDGEQIAHRLCTSCHTFNQGGRAAVGPNLYGVVGAKHGHMEGFNYSAAIKGKEGPWNYEELNHWLFKPQSYAPGTRMAFAGISNNQQRADVIAYLRSISPDAPPPSAEEPTPAATPNPPSGPNTNAPATQAAPATPGTEPHQGPATRSTETPSNAPATRDETQGHSGAVH